MDNPHREGKKSGKHEYPEHRQTQYLHQNRHDPWVTNDDFYPLPGFQATGRIWFEIVTVAGTSQKTADVTVRGSTRGGLLGETVQVVDESNCFMSDETNTALVGRSGWATLMVSQTNNTLHWVVDGLCCP